MDGEIEISEYCQRYKKHGEVVYWVSWNETGCGAHEIGEILKLDGKYYCFDNGPYTRRNFSLHGPYDTPEEVLKRLPFLPGWTEKIWTSVWSFEELMLLLGVTIGPGFRVRFNGSLYRVGEQGTLEVGATDLPPEEVLRRVRLGPH
jgi:hypothetical protein